jgi:hypothetical protein
VVDELVADDEELWRKLLALLGSFSIGRRHAYNRANEVEDGGQGVDQKSDLNSQSSHEDGHDAHQRIDEAQGADEDEEAKSGRPAGNGLAACFLLVTVALEAVVLLA